MDTLEGDHLKICKTLASKENLVIQVKINTTKQADFLLRLMYSDDMQYKKEMPQLVSINYDSAVVSKKDAELIDEMKDQWQG